jgi:hypothetical protein
LACGMRGLSALRVVELLHSLCPEAATCADMGGLLPCHIAARSSCFCVLRFVTDLVIHYATTAVLTPPKVALLAVMFAGRKLGQCNADSGDVSEGEMLRYICSLDASCLSTAVEEGLLPLHVACRQGNLAVIRSLVTAYPQATKVVTEDGRLPLHYWMLRWATLRSHRTITGFEDILRLLLRCNPSAAGVPIDLNAHPSSRLIAGIKPRTTYDLCESLRLPYSVRRLLLLAAPTIDPSELCRLNYEARSGALFLAFSAQSQSDDPLVRVLQRLRSHRDILRLTIAFI